MSLAIVNALEVDIATKDSFELNEDIRFDYTIISDNNERVAYLPYVYCPNLPRPPKFTKSVSLVANKPYRNSYYDLAVDSTIEPQTCTAYLQILSPIQQTVSKEFQIITDPSFSFNLNLCKDQSCTEKSKTFILNKQVYLDYSSSAQNPEVTATLTYPDKTTKIINLPTSITASKTGTHTLEVTASKENYKTITTKTQFAVISKNAEISSLNVQELKAQSLKLSPPTEMPKYLVIFSVIIVLVAIVFLINRKKR
ncbi:MAG: hypothetical protein KJ600_00045 [Nanoarchaeota archaeon]|nr:hypothetical protein [Nanoarchaeota archaeon]MBU1102936.1 hypothetical protein [Nanoarchaeota archaeon]